MLTYEIKDFASLTLTQLYDLLALRAQVFVKEQKCPYVDLDYNDQQSTHILAYQNNELVAYARVLEYSDGMSMSFGRIVTRSTYRGRGYGQSIVKEALDYIDKIKPNSTIKISAQYYLVRFYSEFGFKTQGDIYDEDGLPHILMIKNP